MFRKSGKTKKNDKSQVKMRVFEKNQEKSGNWTKFENSLDFVSLDLLKSLHSKVFKWQKIN